MNNSTTTTIDNNNIEIELKTLNRQNCNEPMGQWNKFSFRHKINQNVKWENKCVPMSVCRCWCWCWCSFICVCSPLEFPLRFFYPHFPNDNIVDISNYPKHTWDTFSFSNKCNETHTHTHMHLERFFSVTNIGFGMIFLTGWPLCRHYNHHQLTIIKLQTKQQREIEKYFSISFSFSFRPPSTLHSSSPRISNKPNYPVRK